MMVSSAYGQLLRMIKVIIHERLPTLNECKCPKIAIRFTPMLR
jgi:hypothetical protein